MALDHAQSGKINSIQKIRTRRTIINYQLLSPLISVFIAKRYCRLKTRDQLSATDHFLGIGVHHSCSLIAKLQDRHEQLIRWSVGATPWSEEATNQCLTICTTNSKTLKSHSHGCQWVLHHEAKRPRSSSFQNTPPIASCYVAMILTRSTNWLLCELNLIYTEEPVRARDMMYSLNKTNHKQSIQAILRRVQ